MMRLKLRMWFICIDIDFCPDSQSIKLNQHKSGISKMMIGQSFKGLNYLRKLQWKLYKGDGLKKISNLREGINSLRTKLDP